MSLSTPYRKALQLTNLLTGGDYAIQSVSFDPPQSVTITHLATATQTQRDNAAAVVSGFDWSDGALTTYEEQAARTPASAALDVTGDPLQVLLRAVVLVVLDEINTLRSALSLTPRTATQVRNAIKNKISAGSADS